MDCGAPVGIIVLADGDARDESLLRFARALIDRPGPEIQVWTRSDVLALDGATEEGESARGGSSYDLHDEAPQLSTRTHAGKYRSLWSWLSQQAPRPVTTTFTELEELMGGPLPPSCRKHPPHWHSYDGSAVPVRSRMRAGRPPPSISPRSESRSSQPLARTIGRDPRPDTGRCTHSSQLGNRAVPRPR